MRQSHWGSQIIYCLFIFIHFFGGAGIFRFFTIHCYRGIRYTQSHVNLQDYFAANISEFKRILDLIRKSAHVCPNKERSKDALTAGILCVISSHFFILLLVVVVGGPVVGNMFIRFEIYCIIYIYIYMIQVDYWTPVTLSARLHLTVVVGCFSLVNDLSPVSRFVYFLLNKML